MGLIGATLAVVIAASLMFRRYIRRLRRRERHARHLAHQRSWDWLMGRSRTKRITFIDSGEEPLS
jgi:hypothetical protein